MKVSRYTADDHMVTAPDGEFVLFKDYAALEARCAGLERERDALLAQDERREMYLIATLNVAERAEAKADALQAKLAAAESIICDEAMDHRAHGFCDCPLCKFADAILAGHAPATKGEGDE